MKDDVLDDKASGKGEMALPQLADMEGNPIALSPAVLAKLQFTEAEVEIIYGAASHEHHALLGEVEIRWGAFLAASQGNPPALAMMERLVHKRRFKERLAQGQKDMMKLLGKDRA